MDSPIPNPLGRVLRRRLIDKSLVREDARKLGLILVGAGVVAAFIDAAPAGYALIAAGAVSSLAGHTETRP